jgi:hypothetical protein
MAKNIPAIPAIPPPTIIPIIDSVYLNFCIDYNWDRILLSYLRLLPNNPKLLKDQVLLCDRMVKFLQPNSQ